MNVVDDLLFGVANVCLLGFRLASCLVLVDVIAIWTLLVLLIDTGRAG
jgi:hypothetical protein